MTLFRSLFPLLIATFVAGCSAATTTPTPNPVNPMTQTTPTSIPTLIPTPTATPIPSITVLKDQQIEYGFDAVRIRVFVRFFDQAQKRLGAELDLSLADTPESAIKPKFDRSKLASYVDVKESDVFLPFDFTIPYDQILYPNQPLSASVRIFDNKQHELEIFTLPNSFFIESGSRPKPDRLTPFVYQGDLYYAVIEEAFSVGSLSGSKIPDPGNKFLVMSIRIENQSDKLLQLYTQDFRLEYGDKIYENNRELEYDAKEAFYQNRDYLRLGKDIRELTASRFAVPKGATRHTMLVFEVPQDLVGATLAFRINNSPYAKSDIFIMPYAPLAKGNFTKPLMVDVKVDQSKLVPLAVLPTSIINDGSRLTWEADDAKFEGESHILIAKNCIGNKPLPIEEISQQYEALRKESLSHDVDVTVELALQSQSVEFLALPVVGFAGFNSLRVALQGRFKQNQQIQTEQKQQTVVVIGSMTVDPGQQIQITIMERKARLTGYLILPSPYGLIRFRYLSQGALGYQIEQQATACSTPTSISTP